MAVKAIVGFDCLAVVTVDGYRRFSVAAVGGYSGFCVTTCGDYRCFAVAPHRPEGVSQALRVTGHSPTGKKEPAIVTVEGNS